MNDPLRARLRSLPSVNTLATAVARAELNSRRREILAGEGGDVDLVKRATRRLQPTTTCVINATGVVLHTNLGRAPLAPAAREAVAAAADGYSALELDVETGSRSRRGRRTESLLIALTGAQDALVVNNGAAAVLLAAAALAGPGAGLIISRGEMVEIGGGLRIADIAAQSGATLVEVGSTNRTRAEDYRAALGPGTGAILRVHQSNFRMTGYVERPSLPELVSLGIPVIDDIGSGALTHMGLPAGEPTAREAVADGAALVCFSGDKLLGGPQAGILVGAARSVEACRVHPLARALRIDKLCLAGLEATLELHMAASGGSEHIPVLEMLAMTDAELSDRTRRLAALTGGTVIVMAAPIGGGSLPGHELPGPAVALCPGPEGAEALAASMRSGEPSVVTRVLDQRVVMSTRTIRCDEIELVAACVERARQHCTGLR